MATSMNTITVNGVTYNYEEYMASQNATKKNVNADYISKDTFLKLLVTQMQYQDPLDPMDNGEYLSQLAQFSALEQMTEVADKMENVHTLVENLDTSVLVGQLTGMIGQNVQWTTTDSEGKTTLHEGTAKSVSISDGAPSLMVETEVKDADGNISKAVTKVDISTLTRIGKGDLPE
ncbi:MAG: flagellar biosynthesis protein FlgD [Selenomonadaceae bacterium]|nr:flagellar biosynthesis protein FlgD [Selenomonadaceae bacterium]